jgi:hypothetical protein
MGDTYMDVNKLKVNYNSSTQTATFQFLSDNGQWVDIHKGSDLSRKKYASAIKDGRITELLEIINKTYNINECGVKIIFSGDADAYSKLQETIEGGFVDISLARTESKNIVVGKRNAGKTCLAEAVMTCLGKIPKIEEYDQYIKFFDSEDDISIYEIKGIDLGIENVDKAYEALVNCIEEGARTVFYCFQAKTGKIENTEIDFIHKIEKAYSEIAVIPVITACIDERMGNEFANKIVDELGRRDVLITLAKEKNTKAGTIPAFGIEQVVKNLAGGKS